MTRLGFAGLGWLGESLLKEVARIPSLSVSALQDVAGERASQLATTYGVPWHGERYEDLLARGDVDAVVISTPNWLHAPQARAALEAGKDVLVQKPLALSCEEARATADLASQTGGVLFVDYSYRFLETVQTLRDAKGAIRNARAAFHNIYGPGADKAWFFDPARSGGGALIDLGVHLLDLGLWLAMPSHVELEQVEVDRASPVEQRARLGLSMDDVPFTVEVSWNASLPATEIFLELDTDDGPVRWENVDGSFFHFRTVRNDVVLMDCETTLREDTLRTFARAMEDRRAPTLDLRVYDVLDRAYAVVRSGAERLP